jgi:hypothetical protein
MEHRLHLKTDASCFSFQTCNSILVGVPKSPRIGAKKANFRISHKQNLPIKSANNAHTTSTFQKASQCGQSMIFPSHLKVEPDSLFCIQSKSKIQVMQFPKFPQMTRTPDFVANATHTFPSPQSRKTHKIRESTPKWKVRNIQFVLKLPTCLCYLISPGISMSCTPKIKFPYFRKQTVLATFECENLTNLMFFSKHPKSHFRPSKSQIPRHSQNPVLTKI